MNSINEFIKDDTHLLECNKYLNELKLKYYKLNKEYSLQYYNDINFRNRIYSKLTNPILQLWLNLTNYDEIIDDGLKHLGRIHTLELYGCELITNEGIKHLGRLNTLILKGCEQITDERIKRISTIKTLTKIYGVVIK